MDDTPAAAMATATASAVAAPSQSPLNAPQHALLLPVFFFHGVLQDATCGASFAAKMAAEGRHMEALAFCSGAVDSTRPLREQVQLAIAQIRAVVQRDPATYSHGYVFIGYSQGGAIARGVVEEMDDHNVKTLISLAGAVNGIFFGPQREDQCALQGFLRELGPALFPPTVFDLSKYCGEQHEGVSEDSSNSSAATSAGDKSTLLAGRFQADFDAFILAHPELQQQFSYFSMARSVVQQRWKASNAFHADLNNVNECGAANGESASDSATEQCECKRERARRRTNFLRLDAAHFFASPADGVIAPWQSSILGQYSELASVHEITSAFASLHVLDMKDTTEYVRDTYGLRTLDARGGLHLHTLPGVAHDSWITDDDTFGTAGPLRFSAIYEEHLRQLL